MSDKKRPYKKLEEALEVEEDTNDDAAESAQQDAVMARLAKYKEMKQEAADKASENDDDFIKENLRELAMMGIHAGRILEDEIEVNGKGRDVECLASIMNSTKDTLKKLQDIKHDAAKLELEKEKLAIRKSSSGQPQGQLTQNNLFVGSHGDMLKALSDMKKMSEEQDVDQNEVIDVEAEKDVPEKTD